MENSKKIKIGNRLVGEDEPCLIVAEISCNHNQKLNTALELINKAKDAGADAVKFQTYTPETITIDVDNEYFRMKKSIWKGQTLYQLYEKTFTPWDWFSQLKKKAEEKGLLFFSSPFDETAVDFLEELGVPAYKVASFEINHIPLLEKIAQTKKPVILSTGLAELEDIQLAVETLREAGTKEIAVLKCVSSYPAPYEDSNLQTISDIKKRFGVVSGLSDHSMSPSVPVAAVALGASIIEKHFILDRKDGGADSMFSLEPTEFGEMVKMVREVEKAVGKVEYGLTEKAKEHKVFMRSIFVVKDIKKGEEFNEENIRIIRPGHGLHPKHYANVLSQHARKDIKRGTPLGWEGIK